MSEEKQECTTPARDISRKAISVGRTLDRLPDGDFALLVTKKPDGTWTLKVLSYACDIDKVLE